MLTRGCAFGFVLAATLLWSAPVHAQSLYWTDGPAKKVQSGAINGVGAPNVIFNAADGISGPGGIAMDETNNLVYFSDGGSKIKRGNIHGTGTPITLFAGLVGVGGMAIDLAGNRIFWADAYAKKIQVGNLNGVGSPTTLFDQSDDLGEPRDVALDVTAGLIYWADFGAKAVMRGNINGSGSPVVVFDSIEAMGVALDPAAGTVFWTSFLYPSAIMSGNSDGSGSPIVLFDASNSIGNPFDIMHNPNDGRIYSTCPFEHRIESGRDDGVGPAQDLFTAVDGLNIPAYLALREQAPLPPPPIIPGQRIYWTDVERVYSTRLDNSEDPTVLYSEANGVHYPTGIVANFETGDLYWCDRLANEVVLGATDGSVAPTTLFDRVSDGVEAPRGLAVDFAGGKLYWAQPASIFRGNLDGSGTRDILYNYFNDVPDDVNRPFGIGLDVANGKIYWADAGSTIAPGFSKIVQGRMDGSGSLNISFDASDGLVEAYGIAIDLDAGLLYWTDHAAGKVQVGNIDGSGSPTDLYTTADGLVAPAGISFDKDSGRLFICDFSASLVMMAASDGTGIIEVYDASGDLYRPTFAIADTAPELRWWVPGLPAASPKSLALSVTALMIAAITAILGAGVRRRRRSTYRTD